jgi:hypothetical protein
MLKYGYSTFSLEILEYCEISKVIDPCGPRTRVLGPQGREQYYMDLLKPEYNILQKAGSIVGFQT